MKRPEPDSRQAQDRAKEAADWLVRQDRGLSASEQDEFLSWLAADPRHGEWLTLHRRLMRGFTALSDWQPEDSRAPNPDLLALPHRRRWLAPLAAAAVLILTTVMWMWLHLPNRPTSAVAVATDEIERRILEDGSSVDLNRGALVTARFTSSERHVTLVQGEALFTVVKDPLRPFVVVAGGFRVRAVGTAFNVRLDESTVEVLVAHGTVRVESDEPPGHSAEHAASTETRFAPFVSAGQRVEVQRGRDTPPQIEEMTEQQTARIGAWQPTMLDFSFAPLKAAVNEFNRRNHVQFVIADLELESLSIAASIRSDNVRGFERFLAGLPGVIVEHRSEKEIVVRRRQ